MVLQVLKTLLDVLFRLALKTELHLSTRIDDCGPLIDLNDRCDSRKLPETGIVDQ